MKIKLYADADSLEPLHELEANERVDEDSILHYAPTGDYFVYFDTDGETFMSFKLADVVAVNVALSSS